MEAQERRERPLFRRASGKNLDAKSAGGIRQPAVEGRQRQPQSNGHCKMKSVESPEHDRRPLGKLASRFTVRGMEGRSIQQTFSQMTLEGSTGSVGLLK